DSEAVAGGGGFGKASAASRLPPPPGRLVWRPLQISVLQSVGRLEPSSAACAVTSIAGLTGSKPNSSSRRHRTLIGSPGRGEAVTAATVAAALGPRWAHVPRP